jgi:hypothetical protein
MPFRFRAPVTAEEKRTYTLRRNTLSRWQVEVEIGISTFVSVVIVVGVGAAGPGADREHGEARPLRNGAHCAHEVALDFVVAVGEVVTISMPQASTCVVLALGWRLVALALGWRLLRILP